ncbi:Protein YigP [Legionella busanensis]|uniref:Ubiquinone biosynthesis accessory factor UbiJ n=1 Tax=Legionella busanensis TaxID=190655 RepID=A0A378JI58_9GAMM|nr:SCP2 sterol-binding domain-containing protein [Legionella busanensis]STX50023.1 Protein YigP [Legionella busanensis]
MIKKYSLKALQAAINQALFLDESMPTKIKTFEGKVIEIIVAPLNVNFYITFTTGQLCLLERVTDDPDTIIHSNPLGLIRLSFLPASKARSLFNDKIRVSGDIELGLAIKKLFDEIDIDWEGHLAHFTGDVIAYQLGSMIRRGVEFKRQLSTSLQNNMTDYLQEELRLFPTHEEVENFFTDIDHLVLEVERLHAQINLLDKQ